MEDSRNKEPSTRKEKDKRLTEHKKLPSQKKANERATSILRMANLKQLKIQTNVTRRVLMELIDYEKEVKIESANTAKMHENNAELHDIKQQENVLADSKMMVPECRKRLKDALVKLKGDVAEATENNPKYEQRDEASDIKDARKLIREVELKLV